MLCPYKYIKRGKIRYTRIMPKSSTGFCEIEHTADWALRVWAPDFPELLRQAAQGMYMLSRISLADGPRLTREFEFPFTDRETLIVDFLSELLFCGEDENLAFDAFQIELTATTGKFQVSGAPILAQSKEIKAVTFHDLIVQENENDYAVNIVFDV
jgi:SHS2 domain-containing protein